MCTYMPFKAIEQGAILAFKGYNIKSIVGKDAALNCV